MKRSPLIATAAFIVAAILLVGYFVYLNQDDSRTAGDKGQNIEESHKNDVREVVWQQLSSVQKARVDGTWEDAIVSKVTLSGVMMMAVEDKTYEGKEVYMVDFPTIDINGLPALVDMETFALVGFAPVD